MAESSDWLPLFPLNTVLFPDGVLPLRVFETRYIDMVRDCLKDGRPFGVVLIRSGSEVGIAAEPEDVGSLAHIVDWDMEEMGVLLLRTRGGQRFRIVELRTLADQRLEARVQLIDSDGTVVPDEKLRACASSLARVIDSIHAKGEAEHGADFISPFSEPVRLDDAGWVANRWSEILPIPMKARQKLLELEDASARLAVIYEFLEEHRLL